MDPTHPQRQVENATATSAGGSPDPDGGGLAQSMDPTHPHGKIEHALAPLRLCARPPDPGLRKRLPHRTGSSHCAHMRNEAEEPTAKILIAAHHSNPHGITHCDPCPGR
ncbi:MAG: hypothetical protein ACOX52_09680 [Verrucomicrobiota bacterium]